MVIHSLGNVVFLLCVFAVTLAGCRHSGPPAGGPAVEPRQVASPSAARTTFGEATSSNASTTGGLGPTETASAAQIDPEAVEPLEHIARLLSSATQSTQDDPPEVDQGHIDEQAGGHEPTTQPAVRMPLVEQHGDTEELVSVNFEQVDIRTVVKTIGDITGINFVVDENVRGAVTVMSPTKIPLGQVYSVLESILDVHGFAAVPAGEMVKIVPKAEAVRRNLQVRIGGDPNQIPMSDSIVTQIIPLKYADAAEVAQVIRPLLPTSSQVSEYPRTNSIVITDTSSNIRHIAGIIHRLDTPGSRENVTTFTLKFASAAALGEQISRITENSPALSGAARGSGAQSSATNIKIIPDTRTNLLIVVANEYNTRAIERMIKQLDVERPPGANNIHVVYLRNAQSKEVAESLKAALTNLRITGVVDGTQQIQVTADEGTNAVIIVAAPQDYQIVAEIIDKLDIVREQVLVEMLILEISEDALKEIGVDWATLDEAVTDSVRFFGSTNLGPRVDFVSGDLEGLAIGAWKSDGTNVQIGTILKALEKQSGVNILSTPHVVTSNHRKAKIIVGENQPFVTQSRITETTDLLTPTVIKQYEYKDVGITMEITPHISQGGLIRLEISSQFTKLIEDVTSTSTDTPTTAKREAQTVVSVNNGSTVVIGGLIRDDKVTIEKKVPVLGDAPLIGPLFKSRRERVQKTNLLMFITPHILASEQDMEQITRQKRQQMESAMQKQTGPKNKTP